MLVPVLLSGGTGSRLWPVSRSCYPKQFVKLFDPEFSMLQQTAKRLDELELEKSGWIVVAGEQHRFLVANQLSEVEAKVECIILEPFARNTAPAIALAAIQALKFSPNARLLVQPADHIIPDTKSFCELIDAGLAANRPILTFGVVPKHAETGFGYIEVGQKIEETGAFDVVSFKEKPNQGLANNYFAGGKHLWNSGMFLIDAKKYMNELECFQPEIVDVCIEASEHACNDFGFLRIDQKKFEACPSISIDHAVIEQSKNVSVMPFKGCWSDVGAWDALSNEMPSDEEKNVIIGDGLAVDSVNTFIKSDSRLVATLGVSNLCVIETPDAVLVMPKDSAQEVKKIVDLLARSDRKETFEHKSVHRPWGSYQVLAEGESFQVKKLIVKPGKSLSLQLHRYRSEHWVVVSGVAEIQNGSDELTLVQNESTYINVNTKHRLTNTQKSDLILIETQTGSYFGEDDIVRFEDSFGRLDNHN